MQNKKKKLILLELNEVSFNVIKSYIDDGISLPNFQKVMDSNFITTRGEEKYEELEPWIQWPSVHTGLKYDEHKIFRLGDIVKSQIPQIFEEVESYGYSVGAVSPMNSANRLKRPAYFIPDPWTKTPSDGSWLSKIITNSITQAVNDNSANKLTLKTILGLIVACLFLIRVDKLFKLAKFTLSSIGKPWRKAIFLDLLLNEFHLSFFKKFKPNFSTLFLNACAHIQHHYFYSSKVINTPEENPEWYLSKKFDPLLEVFEVYDKLVGNYLSMSNTELIIATGLSQEPASNNNFYYRLKNHSKFLKMLNIDFEDVHTRMTRDFLIIFRDMHDADKAQNILSGLEIKNNKFFGHIDRRGNEIFVTLTYSKQIDEKTILKFQDTEIKMQNFVNFVAIKNGMHSSKGYLHVSKNLQSFLPKVELHVSSINQIIKKFFNGQKA